MTLEGSVPFPSTPVTRALIPGAGGGLAVCGHTGGYDIFNVMVETALVSEETEKATERFNGGEPFPAIEGEFRRGRPLRNSQCKRSK